jgi:hypothetical protein
MATNSTKKKSARTQSTAVQVRSGSDVVKTFNQGVEYLFHTRIGKKFKAATQKTIVAYGPWLAAALLLFVLPELLIFAKENKFVGISGFFTSIFFNQASWILMVVVLANCLLLADGLSDIFAKKKRGWDRIYIALLLNTLYLLSQLAQNLTQPAAPLLSLAVICLALFTHFDIKKYYK